jgi:ribosome-associated protein
LNSKPSKSAKKREYLALQELGEQLIALSPEQLRDIDMDETLLDAVLAARSMTSRGALRRQKQLIGKLMRRVDPNPIRAALYALGSGDRIDKQLFKEAEIWRDRIAAGGMEDLDAYFARIDHRNGTLEDHVRALRQAPNNRAQKQAMRGIFREIHKDLVDEMQKQAPTI